MNCVTTRSTFPRSLRDSLRWHEASPVLSHTKAQGFIDIAHVGARGEHAECCASGESVGQRSRRDGGGVTAPASTIALLRCLTPRHISISERREDGTR